MTHELIDQVDHTLDGMIVRYDYTASQLAELRAKYSGIVFDCLQPDQDKAARVARKELVTLRTSLEAKRKEIKAPYLTTCKEIDDKAKAIEAEIIALEKPIDAQIKIEESRKEAIKLEAERVEFERVAAIKARIATIAQVRINALSMTAQQLEAALSCDFDFSGFEEFEAEARAAHQETAQAIASMLALRQQQEADHQELERERKALADERYAARLEKLAMAEELKAMAEELERANAKIAPVTPESVMTQVVELVNEANIARLHAAAEQMLDALEHCVEVLDEHSPFEKNARDLALAAIEAATGVAHA